MYFACIVFIVLIFSGCGRKSKDIFSFAKKEIPRSKKSLMLPAVQNIQTHAEGNSMVVSWDHVDKEAMPHMQFVGYSVYRLRSWGVVPKDPLNKRFIQENKFMDKLSTDSFKQIRSYVVRAVFQEGPTLVFGPISKISR